MQANKIYIYAYDNKKIIMIFLFKFGVDKCAIFERKYHVIEKKITVCSLIHRNICMIIDSGHVHWKRKSNPRKMANQKVANEIL